MIEIPAGDIPVSFKQPAWRWQEALRYAAARNGEYKIRYHADTPLMDAAYWYSQGMDLLRNPDWYQQKNPLMHEVFLLQSMASPYGGYRWLIEAMIMAGATDEDVGKQIPLRCGEDTVAYYRKLFLDVGYYLHLPCCVLGNIFSTCPLTAIGLHDFDLSWKLLGYAKGFDAVMELVRFRCGKPLSKGIREWLRDMTRDRLLFHNFVVTTDLRQHYTQQAMEVIDLMARTWEEGDKLVSIPENSDIVARQVLEAVQNVLLSPELEQRSQMVKPKHEYDAVFNLTPEAEKQT